MAGALEPVHAYAVRAQSLRRQGVLDLPSVSPIIAQRICPLSLVAVTHHAKNAINSSLETRVTEPFPNSSAPLPSLHVHTAFSAHSRKSLVSCFDGE
jgi:hypothetical protein